MKMNKGAILASIVIIMVASVLAGAGTTAYFSTGEKTTSKYTMNAATMKMRITAGPYTFDKLVPGQEFGPIVIEIENTGTMDINYLCGNLELEGGIDLVPADVAWKMADKIEVVAWHEYLPGYQWIDNFGEAFEEPEDPAYSTKVKDNTDPFTLLELAQSYLIGGTEPAWMAERKINQFGGYVGRLTDWITGYGYDETPSNVPAIEEGGTYYMKLWFKFSESAGNDLQGKTLTFTITFLGVQDYLSQTP